MAYRLSFDGAPAEAVRRVAREQLEDAVSRLREGEDAETAVHEARKDLKKTRALLRLVRPGMKRKAYRRRNRALRDAGRALSGARDADVLKETLEALEERFSRRFEAPELPPAPDIDLRAHAERLAAFDVEDWPLKRVDERVWRDGIVTSYTRGREAFARADSVPTTENLHEWRKRVKDLWYHQRLLRDSWDGVLKAEAKESKRLSQVLGDDHDLAVLAEHVSDPEVLELIGYRREELLGRARELGRLVYAEKPKAFRRRLGRYVVLAA
jgi:CHAD domain-containing protein